MLVLLADPMCRLVLPPYCLDSPKLGWKIADQTEHCHEFYFRQADKCFLPRYRFPHLGKQTVEHAVGCAWRELNVSQYNLSFLLWKIRARLQLGNQGWWEKLSREDSQGSLIRVATCYDSVQKALRDR